MTLAEFIVLLVVAGVCGSLAQSMVGYTSGGCLVTIALGFVGALLGTWLARAVGLPDIVTLMIGGQAFPVVWSIVGAALFVAILRLVASQGILRR